MQTIRVTVEGGIVQDVENVPHGFEVEVRDFDSDECEDDCDRCEMTDAGERFHRTIYHGATDPAAMLADLVRWYDTESDDRDLDDPVWERARRMVAS